MPRLSVYKKVFNGENAQLLLGRVLAVRPADKSCKVRCLRLSQDPNLLKYYYYRKQYWAVDADRRSSVGDVVLIKQLPNPLSIHVSHELKKVVFPLGNVTDPITGEKCVGRDYAADVSNPNMPSRRL